MATSPELTSGHGFTFEAAVAASYLAGLVTESSAAGLGEAWVTNVALQQAGFGEPLDDVIVDGRRGDHQIVRLSLQVKRSLTVSAAKTNSDFREVIKNSWLTYKKEDFRQGVDRYGVAVGNISDTGFRTFTTLCELARASSSEDHFNRRFDETGSASGSLKACKGVISTILADEIAPHCVSELHGFLSHLLCVKFDFLHTGATTPGPIATQLRTVLPPEQHDLASELFQLLQAEARDGAGRSASYDRPSLLRRLPPQFLVAPSSGIQGDIERLQACARLWLADIGQAIAGITIQRENLVNQVHDALGDYRFVQIRGDAGTGKSAVLRSCSETMLSDGPLVFLKADRISGRSWHECKNSLGLSGDEDDALFAEIERTGSPTFVVDGIDRVSQDQRAVVVDLVRLLRIGEDQSNWRMLVTTRDAGIEPLRNWLPDNLFSLGGVGTVEVEAFNSDEARYLVAAVPALGPLLFGSGPVREIARRPFFASIIARRVQNSSDGSTPTSEPALSEIWWASGGYNETSHQARQRQRTLCELAGEVLKAPGRPISQAALGDLAIGQLDHLISDGVLLEERQGHLIRFAHDIFFEWAAFHYLASKQDNWLEALGEVGEPPILGRVVELLSQAMFDEGDKWIAELNRLAGYGLRPQWKRAWLLGPLDLPTIVISESAYSTVLTANDFALLRRLLVWFQAERTVPNPLVLSGQLLPADRPRHEILRFADALGWPGGIRAWARLLHWLIDQSDHLPGDLVPDVVAVMQVWQNGFADDANAVSDRVIPKCVEWLKSVEDYQHPTNFRNRSTAWDDLGRDDVEDLESYLRSLVLRAARTSSDMVGDYLRDSARTKYVHRAVFNQVTSFSPLLTQTHPRELVDFTALEVLQELPEELDRRLRAEAEQKGERLRELRAKPEEELTDNERRYLDNAGLSVFAYHSFSHHDWRKLSVGRGLGEFFPASPLREPFHSLFEYAPDKARAFVRDLTNHAITAWLQLHNLASENRGTPLPQTIEFPWGEQEFWGGSQEYTWARGWWGPNIVRCALLALERWALKQLDEGRDLEGVLRDVLDGHQSVAPLCIAVALFLKTQQANAATLPLVKSQGLWKFDIDRIVHEQTNAQSSLIGFHRPEHIEHRDAIIEGNKLEFRNTDLRQLSLLFVLSRDEFVRNEARSAIQSFPEALPYAYQEDIASPEITEALLKRARQWAEYGKAENYTSSAVPDQEQKTHIELNNPQVDQEEAQAARQQFVQLNRELGLWNWVDGYLKGASDNQEKSVQQAIEEAKSLDRDDLFELSKDTDLKDVLAGAIAGVAAIALENYGQIDPGDIEWAQASIRRAAMAKEESEDTYRWSVVPWHHAKYTARGLAACVKAGLPFPDAADMLFSLIGHPIEEVSVDAVGAAASCVDVDPQLACHGLDLAFKLAIQRRRHPGEADDRQISVEEQRATMVTETSNSYRGGEVLSTFSGPPPAWVHDTSSQQPEHQDEEDDIQDQDGWRTPDDYWVPSYAGKILEKIPYAYFMSSARYRSSLIALLEQLIVWTIDSIEPPWQDARELPRNDDGTVSFEWRVALADALVQISQHMEAEEFLATFMEPVFGLQDERCWSILSRFVSLHICTCVLDAPTVSENSIQVIERCLDRFLQNRDFRATGYRDGEVHGYDAPHLIRSFLFVEVERADKAVRFANGDWTELPIFLPTVDRFVRNAGWVTSVASSWLTLCERSESLYPSDLFADQVLCIFESDVSLPGSWRRSILPARIAGLVQRFSDQQQTLDHELASKFLRILDHLVDMGDRRAAALQKSQTFRDVKAA